MFQNHLLIYLILSVVQRAKTHSWESAHQVSMRLKNRLDAVWREIVFFLFHFSWPLYCCCCSGSWKRSTWLVSCCCSAKYFSWALVIRSDLLIEAYSGPTNLTRSEGVKPKGLTGLAPSKIFKKLDISLRPLVAGDILKMFLVSTTCLPANIHCQ